MFLVCQAKVKSWPARNGKGATSAPQQQQPIIRCSELINTVV